MPRAASKARKGKGKGQSGQPTQRACFNCGQVGDMKRDCRNPPARGGGKGGKVSGKGGKGGGKGDRQQIQCGKCGKFGHRAAECRGGAPAGKGGKGGGRGGQTSTTATTTRSTFSGVCWKCGTPGHRAADRRRVLALDGETVEAPVQTIVPMDPWLLNIDGLEVDAVGGAGSRAMLLEDSGAYAHVCPMDFAKHVPLEEKQGTAVAMAADGRGMEMYGQKEVGLALGGGRPARVVFQVINMRRPILSVAALRSHGVEVHFTASGAYLVRGDLAPGAVVQGPRPCSTPAVLSQVGHAPIVNAVVARLAEAVRMGFCPVIWASLPCTPWSQCSGSRSTRRSARPRWSTSRRNDARAWAWCGSWLERCNN